MAIFWKCCGNDMPKWDSMIFIAIVFTILNDTDNEIVMQNHYVCYNYFDKYFWQCPFSFPNRLSLFQQNCESTSTQELFMSKNFIIRQKCWTISAKYFSEIKKIIQKSCAKKGNTDQVLTINLKISQQKKFVV